MVYFVAHTVLKHGAWLPLSSVPVSAVDLKDDGSSRNLSTFSHSLQLVSQGGRLVKPLSGAVIKTTYIKVFQRRFRSYVAARRKWGLPGNLLLREIGIMPRTHVRSATMPRRS